MEDRLVKFTQRVKLVSERVFALADGPKYHPIKPVSVCTEVSSSVVVWPWTPQDQRLAPKKISVRHGQKCDNEMAITEFSLKLGIYQLELDRLEWLYIHVVDYSSKRD